MEDLKLKLQQILDQKEWSREDKEWLLSYLANTGRDELKELLEHDYRINVLPDQTLDPVISQQLLNNLHDKIRSTSRVVRMRRIGLAAASLTGLLIIGALFWNNRKADSAPAVTFSKNEGTPGREIPPGGNKAILTLANGSNIVLGDVKNGALARQGNTTIVKADGKLSYETAQKASGAMLFNTIVTPRGGQYQVVLPDGSEVWLNAASSLRFPTAFTGKDRRVEITGEAYFEIAKDATRPFFVKIGSSEVQVLGTHFDIMAYTEESTLKTTLIEGSVRFVNGGNASILAPGQQSRLNKDGGISIAGNVDATEVLAWKNGLFHFENAGIEDVMRQMSRWYDVDIVYGNKKDINRFYADIPRTTNLSDALKALSLTGKVHFEIQEKKIIVKE
ncbi:MAG TPA: FecR domain-containing protein [Puia sp.]|jgi:ferric-dicitrate binding protein FerR (iron transport regulator)